MKREKLIKLITAVIVITMLFSLLTACRDKAGNSLKNNQSVESNITDSAEGINSSTQSTDTLSDILFSEETKQKEEIPKLSEEEKLKIEQLNSFSMMYYLAITAEKIRTSKDNRVILEDIYTSLLNDINPGSVDEITQDHLKNLRDIIKSYLLISTKRDRLQYIYNQEKAAAIRSAVPNPLGILSMTNSFNWKKLAVSIGYTLIDSISNYKNANDTADKNFLMSGWELDDEEVAAVQKNRDRAFDYMVDMVQEYNLDGMLTLNEQAIENFAEICAIKSIPEKIKRLEADKETYQLLGNYWLELADCYFETSQYQKCLDCVDKYNSLSTGIYRRDYNYVQILPKAIVAAQEIYTGEQYIFVINEFANAIIKNTPTTDWSNRYFAAQVYLDLYTRTKDEKYIKAAYKISSENVTVLLSGQRELNTTYMNPVVDVIAQEPDYKYMTDDEKKAAEKELKAEKKRVKNYNKELKNIRKTELPSLYEPLILNCELLFALADKMNISESEKAEIEAILETPKGGIFITRPINDAYSFSKEKKEYNVEISKKEIIIPADLLTAGSTINVSVQDGDKMTTFDDCHISKVDRDGNAIDSFKAHLQSKQFKKYDWTKDSKITITITYGDAYDKTLVLKYAVIKFEKHWYGDKVTFG